MPIVDNPLTALNLKRHLKLLLVPLTLIAGMLGSGALVYSLAQNLRQDMATDAVRQVLPFAAQQLRIEELTAIAPEKAIGTPYHGLVVQLKAARRLVPKARKVYVLQYAPAGWSYIAATDTFDGPELLDRDGDGAVDETEQSPQFGTPYEDSLLSSLLGSAFEPGSPQEQVALAQTGATFVAYAPLRNGKGEIKGLLGMEANLGARTEYSVRVGFLLAGIFVFGLLLSQCAHLIFRKRNLSIEKQMDSERLALMELATHQLGAPLATFRWWMELLKDPDTSDTVDRLSVIEQVGDAVNRLDGIVKALSNATKVGLGEVKMEEQILGSLKNIILRAVQDCTPRIKMQCLRVRVLYDDSTGPVKVDSDQFFEVMKELVDNAISFSPPNTVITIQVGRRKNMCQVDVSDQGYGIPEDDLHRIGEKFFRAGNASKYKPVGNGMGLFNVKGIVEKHGGKLSIVSREGKGTTVSFSLKLAPKQEGVQTELV